VITISFLGAGLMSLVGGVGIIFAVNSALQSYLVLVLTKAEQAMMDVGFCYMAKAGRRLFVTVLSGLTYQGGRLTLMPGTAASMVAISALAAGRLDPNISMEATA
jgi:hypothetical protein